MQNKTEAAAFSKEHSETDYFGQLSEFQRSGVKGFEHAYRHKLNPFAAQRFSFDAATQVAESLVHDFGKWQNEECMAMKEALMTLDPNGIGRVPLKVFWAQPDTEIYSFTESQQFLRSVGALDESPNQAPSVRIANYLASPSNCIAQSGYTAICCLDECAGLMGDLEGLIRGPTAEPLHLLRLVQNMSSSTVDAPRTVPAVLADKLARIAEKNDGSIPLHGRLFAQWMHFAFPNECPYPAEETPFETTTRSKFNKSSALSYTEKETFSKNIVDHGADVSSASVMESHWRDTEVLPLLLNEAEAAQGRQLFRSVFSSAMPWIAKGALIFVGARLAYGTWRSAFAHASATGADFMEQDKKVGTIV